MNLLDNGIYRNVSLSSLYLPLTAAIQFAAICIKWVTDLFYVLDIYKEHAVLSMSIHYEKEGNSFTDHFKNQKTKKVERREKYFSWIRGSYFPHRRLKEKPVFPTHLYSPPYANTGKN